MNSHSVSVTRHVEFEAAHLLADYPGACANLHGHSYKLEVTICGPQQDDFFGFVMDFKVLDRILKSVVPDHKFIYNSLSEDPLETELVGLLKSHEKSIWGMPGYPSAENMVGIFAKKIQEQLPTDYFVTQVKLWETTNSFATWRRT